MIPTPDAYALRGDTLEYDATLHGNGGNDIVHGVFTQAAGTGRLEIVGSVSRIETTVVNTGRHTTQIHPLIRAEFPPACSA
jgi:hypothetical protein